MELSSSNCKFINFLFNINRIYNKIHSEEIQTSSNKSKSIQMITISKIISHQSHSSSGKCGIAS